MGLETAARYWHTVRHLKPSQIFGRLRFRLVQPRADQRPAPPRRPLLGWITAAERAPSMVGPSRFSFLHEVRELSQTGWDDPGAAKLWRYHLHYFDDCNALGAEDRSAWHDLLIDRWVREHPPGSGTGWEPYPTSLRLVNWIKRDWRGRRLSPVALHSLAIQTRWLADRLETHLLGNHLCANAKALVFAGFFFEGKESERWLDQGLRILADQLPEQILADGGQFERSPMYHALALEDLLDLCNAAGAAADALPLEWRALAASWRDTVGPMRRWLAGMCHPDGEISHFNDSAIGVTPPPAELDRYATRLGFPDVPTSTPVLTLGESGYIRIERGPAIAILDVGPIGPDYLPAHAHADTLSFELSAHGHRVLVNSGTSVYAVGPERLRQRGTAAHNTVVVNGQDSSEVWSAFRVARRARPMGLEIVGGDRLTVRCAHDGYLRLPGNPVHRREWRLEPGALTVFDRVDGSFRTAQARFHLHPRIAAEPGADGSVTLRIPGGQLIRFIAQGGTARLEPTSWHPGFGVSEPSQGIAIDFDGSELRTLIQWDKV